MRHNQSLKSPLDRNPINGDTPRRTVGNDVMGCLRAGERALFDCPKTESDSELAAT
jgi:hypothetical protein